MVWHVWDEVLVLFPMAHPGFAHSASLVVYTIALVNLYKPHEECFVAISESPTRGRPFEDQLWVFVSIV